MAQQLNLRLPHRTKPVEAAENITSQYTDTTSAPTITDTNGNGWQIGGGVPSSWQIGGGMTNPSAGYPIGGSGSVGTGTITPGRIGPIPGGTTSSYVWASSTPPIQSEDHLFVKRTSVEKLIDEVKGRIQDLTDNIRRIDLMIEDIDNEVITTDLWDMQFLMESSLRLLKEHLELYEKEFNTL